MCYEVDYRALNGIRFAREHNVTFWAEHGEENLTASFMLVTPPHFFIGTLFQPERSVTIGFTP